MQLLPLLAQLLAPLAADAALPPIYSINASTETTALVSRSPHVPPGPPQIRTSLDPAGRRLLVTFPSLVATTYRSAQLWVGCEPPADADPYAWFWSRNCAAGRNALRYACDARLSHLRDRAAGCGRGPHRLLPGRALCGRSLFLAAHMVGVKSAVDGDDGAEGPVEFTAWGQGKPIGEPKEGEGGMAQYFEVVISCSEP